MVGWQTYTVPSEASDRLRAWLWPSGSRGSLLFSTGTCESSPPRACNMYGALCMARRSVRVTVSTPPSSPVSSCGQPLSSTALVSSRPAPGKTIGLASALSASGWEPMRPRVVYLK